jgi:uncharacterized membrane protein
MTRLRTLLLIALIVIFSLCASTDLAQAQEPVVQAVLFYSPTCGHCAYVINEVLPPLVEKYGTQLVIFGVDTYTAEGSLLYQNYIQQFNVPPEQQAVPTLVIGDQILIGSGQIPEELPGIVEEGLKNGGIPWPDISGLEEARNGTLEVPEQATPMVEHSSSLGDRFTADLQGNILAVIVLAGMIAALVYAGVSFTKNSRGEKTPQWPSWLIPALSILGFGVAIYLSYVEVNQVEAVCGPVGDCNSVQQSTYATLFGFLPVGVLGVLGYIAICITWLIGRLDLAGWKKTVELVMWVLTLAGTLFSIYLTFLEPFVIGATCMWCISSAVIMTLLFLTATFEMQKD